MGPSQLSTVKRFNLPDLGEGLTEGEIIKWLVSVGDTVELNQPIVEVETAKAAVEIPAKWAGRVETIFHAEGETVDVGTPLIAIETDPTGSAGSSGTDAPPEEATVLVGYGPRAGSVKRRPRRSAPPAPVATATPVAPASRVAPAPQSAPGPATDRVLAKPPVRKLARDLGVDLYAVNGTGPTGSITRGDVEAAADALSVAAEALPVAAEALPVAADATTPGGSRPVFGPDREQRIPVRGVRKLTAENMVASAFTAPHVSEFLTVDVTRSMRALDRLRRAPEWQDVRISPLLLVAKAVLLAVGRHPLVNSTWSEASGEIVVKEYVNLGIAAATERGLIVPNIKDAGRLSLRELADALTALVQTAKAGRTPPADMSGGTFTITNVGVFGVDAGTPILPPGEAAILGFGAVREAPWAHQGKVKVRQVTTLSLSFDHRVIDGELGSNFLSDIGRFLTDPQTALLAWC